MGNMFCGQLLYGNKKENFSDTIINNSGISMHILRQINNNNFIFDTAPLDNFFQTFSFSRNFNVSIFLIFVRNLSIFLLGSPKTFLRNIMKNNKLFRNKKQEVQDNIR